MSDPFGMCVYPHTPPAIRHAQRETGPAASDGSRTAGTAGRDGYRPLHPFGPDPQLKPLPVTAPAVSHVLADETVYWNQDIARFKAQQRIAMSIDSRPRMVSGLGVAVTPSRRWWQRLIRHFARHTI